MSAEPLARKRLARQRQSAASERTKKARSAQIRNDRREAQGEARRASP